MSGSGETHAAHPGAQTLPSKRQAPAQRGETVYLPTLFDRLCDDRPSERQEAPSAYTPTRARMRQIVQRDMAFLLNTTNQSDWLSSTDYPEAANSTINYGVASLAGSYLSEKKWQDIETMIRHAIEVFEPRLIAESLSVRPMQKAADQKHYNVLTFEIAGYLRMTPYPLEFIVQSSVDLESNRITLTPVNHRAVADSAD